MVKTAKKLCLKKPEKMLKKLKKNLWQKVNNKYVAEISTFCTVGKNPQKIIIEKIKKLYKNAEFHADFENAEKVAKKCTQKKILTKMWQKSSVF